MRNKTPSQSGENEIQIKLKPILGINPGVYLTALYSFILLLIIFILLFYPGIKNPGAAVIVKTEPAGAAVRIDGVYMGVSGKTIFVPKGAREIEVVMPGFETQSAVHKIPGRIFASRFFPIRYETAFSLKTNDVQAALALYAADFAAWTFAGEPSERWQIPMSLSEGAYRVGAQQAGNEERLQSILTAASRFTVTRASARDLLRAKFLLDNNGSPPSPVSLLGSVSDILKFLSENPGSAQWLGELIPGETGDAIEKSAWYANTAYSIRNTQTGTGQRGQQITVAGLEFTGIPANQNNGTGAFYIGSFAIPRFSFETFLNENPQWREQYTDYSLEELAINPMEAFSRGTITGITWFAADAYCKWLTQRLPRSMAGMEVRLPKEKEWEYAASFIANMNNPGWEWLDDPFVPLPFIAVSQEAVKAVSSPEKTLRGRPSINSNETRASLPPNLSSPFVTIRPIIAPIIIIAERN